MMIRSAVLASILVSLVAHTQVPRVTKVDPPNWWVNMPAPMLLVNGENLTGARFSISGGVPIDHTTVSPNGHWAELWLAKGVSHPESVTITAQTPSGKAEIPFRFEARRAANDGLAGFSSRDVMYLIMTDRFADGDAANDGESARETASSAAAASAHSNPKGWHGGDLRGVMNHLDYLQALGIDTVWITPVYQNHSPEAYHGYHATDMYKVDEHYGSLDDLKALGKALHARSMKLVLDTVPNHVGPKHPWVEDEPETTWFHGTKAQHASPVYDFAPLTNPYAPWRDQKNVTEGWFVDLLPDNNQENVSVSKYLTQNAIWWTEESGADGLRIDTFPYVGRTFWNGFHSALHSLYPNLTTVGEVSNGDPRIVSSFAGGVMRDGVDTGLSTPLDFPLHFAIRNAFTGASPMTELATTLRQDSLYPHPERLVPFLDNHDLIRFASEPGGTLPAEKLAMAFLLTVRGMPHLYAGNEIYMQGAIDPDDRRDFPGGFSGAEQSAFNAAGRTPEQAEMFDWTSSLLALRNRTPALQTGTMQVLYSSNDSIVYMRSAGKARVLVAIHRGPEDTTLHLRTTDTAIAGPISGTVLLGKGRFAAETDGLVITLPADGVLLANLSE